MPHEEILQRIKRLRRQLVVPPPFNSDDRTSKHLEAKRARLDKVDRITLDDYFTPYNVNQLMNMEGIILPKLYRFSSGQINSANAGDTVLTTGIANKILLILATTSYKVAGTTQAWRYEMDTGAAFGTTRRLSPTDTNDKEMQGQIYYLTEAERIVINVTTAVASSTIDFTISFCEIGFGTVWGQT